VDSVKSVKWLNEAVADELTAIHQYMYWHFHLDDQGFAPLAALLKQIAMMEMVHTERLAERILFLKGDVVMVPASGVEKITVAQEILNSAAKMERAAIEMYNRFALESGANADSASKQLFESLVNDEEGHFDEFDKQLEKIEQFGPSYLALQSFGQFPGEAATPGQ
jgi:bacterioferritin